jgi:antitoxin HicB
VSYDKTNPADPRDTISKRDTLRRKLRNKSLEYYLGLPYTIEIIPDEDDGGYVARIRELPGCLTQADSWDELQAMSAAAKRLWLESALAHGDPIPEPLGVFG